MEFAKYWPFEEPLWRWRFGGGSLFSMYLATTDVHSHEPVMQHDGSGGHYMRPCRRRRESGSTWISWDTFFGLFFCLGSPWHRARTVERRIV
jgi:hypothetical protein